MTTPSKMKPLNSFLLQAYYNWLLASGCRVFISVNADAVQLELQPYIREGLLTLNISPNAAPTVTITEEYLSTGMAFGGRHVDVWVPIHGIIAIFEPETGNGMGLPVMAATAAPAPASEKPRPALSVVK